MLVEEKRRKKAAYMREYRCKNREKVNEIQRRTYHHRMEDPEYAARMREEWKKNMRERRHTDLVYRVGVHTTVSGEKRKVIPITIRKAIIKRANGKCESKSRPCKGSLGTHHINGNPENNELSNLRLLCMRHHKREDRHGRSRACLKVRIDTVCGFCGTPLSVTPSRIQNSKSGLVFCNKQCFGKFYSQGGFNSL